MERIIVGVDGSSASYDAVTWALAHAKERGSELQIVHVYGPSGDQNPYTSSYADAGSKTAKRLTDSEAKWREEQQAKVKEHGERVVKQVVDGVENSDPKTVIKTDVIASSRPAQALIERARDADLLVVGSRGRGGFKGLLLGSVSQQCVQHATCPVVVVRSKDAKDAKDAKGAKKR